MLKKIVTILAGAVLLVSLAVTPAQATGLPCYSGNVCVYTGTQFGGDMYAWSQSQFIGTCVPMQGSFDQTMSSFIVRTPNAKIKFFGGTWCTGTSTGYYFYEHTHASMESGRDNWARSFLMALN